MANRLTDIRARRVSFVDKAAVRDPSDSSQPRRFVLMKAERSPTDERTSPMAAATAPTTHATSASDLELPEEAAIGVRAAQIALEHVAHLDPRVAPIANRCDSLLNPGGEAKAIAKLDAEVTRLQKSDTSLSRYNAMERARRENPALARELAAAMRGGAA